MGANAQTTVPTFTAGQVLTAAQMNQVNTGVPVFADSSARDAAFGGTGEKTLALGQLCFLESTSEVQFYDGSSWVAVGTSGLVYITGASFSTVTSFSLPNGTFTSAYRNYRVIIQITDVTADSLFSVRLRASGTDTATDYDNNFYGGANTGAIVNYVYSNNDTHWDFAGSDATLDYYSASFDVIGPQIASETSILGTIQFPNTAGTLIGYASGGGTQRDTTQFDSLSFISDVASSITGVYRVYAYADS